MTESLTGIIQEQISSGVSKRHIANSQKSEKMYTVTGSESCGKRREPTGVIGAVSIEIGNYRVTGMADAGFLRHARILELLTKRKKHNHPLYGIMNMKGMILMMGKKISKCVSSGMLSQSIRRAKTDRIDAVKESDGSVNNSSQIGLEPLMK